MQKEDCKYFDDCSAPLCPLDDSSLQHGTWFPSEDTCKVQPLPDWVKRQRKIARKLDYNFNAGSFTVRMLKHKFVITAALTGLNPDKGPVHSQDKQIERWFRDHPEHKPTEKQIEAGKNIGNPAGKTA